MRPQVVLADKKSKSLTPAIFQLSETKMSGHMSWLDPGAFQTIFAFHL